MTSISLARSFSSCLSTSASIAKFIRSPLPLTLLSLSLSLVSRSLFSNECNRHFSYSMANSYFSFFRSSSRSRIFFSFISIWSNYLVWSSITFPMVSRSRSLELSSVLSCVPVVWSWRMLWSREEISACWDTTLSLRSLISLSFVFISDTNYWSRLSIFYFIELLVFWSIVFSRLAWSNFLSIDYSLSRDRSSSSFV